jgi:hypothetical protein
MTGPVRSLEALIAKWRAKAEAIRLSDGDSYHVVRCADELEALIAAGRSAPTRWTGLMAGFAPADTDRSTTNSGDTGGPTEQP